MTRSQIERFNSATRRLYDPEKNVGIRQFRGVDGEGGNVPEEGTLFDEIRRHQYLSLRSGPDLLATGKPLHWTECFEFLCSRPGLRIDVAYFFDYDVTMMIRTMPKERAIRLLSRHLRVNEKHHAIMPLDIGDYQCDYLPHKEFKVRHKDQKKWSVISDVGQFFQAPFLKTLEKWDIGTPEEREMIRVGKSMRADFAELSEETKAYNALECLLLEQLMTEFREVCYQTGYVPRKWQGPGYLASAMLERHRVPKRDDIPILKNESFRLLAQAGYYGGRFETTAVGPVPGPVYQYDINGAYVALLRTLPCLTHGSWRQVRSRPDNESLWFGEVYFYHEPEKTLANLVPEGEPHPRDYLMNLPVRREDGSIYFPRIGNGVYWSTELLAAERAGTILDFKQGWVYEPHCSCRWFDFVDDYYAERVRLGKSNKGMVLKLAGNSIYGKLAQSIGYAPWANPVWAGMITAGCRAMLIDAYRQAPHQCYMLATDGLFMGTQIDVPVSTNLGEWELTVHPEGMFIVQPGVYFLPEGEVKTRGVERGRISGMREEFEKQFDKFVASGGIDHTVSVPVDNFVTARQAIARNKWELAGSWERTFREISFAFGLKRKGGVAFSHDGVLRTLPHNGGADVHSVSYSRNIGGGMIVPESQRYQDVALQESERMSQQPDWVQPLFDISLSNRYHSGGSRRNQQGMLTIKRAASPKRKESRWLFANQSEWTCRQTISPMHADRTATTAPSCVRFSGASPRRSTSWLTRKQSGSPSRTARPTSCGTCSRHPARLWSTSFSLSTLAAKLSRTTSLSGTQSRRTRRSGARRRKGGSTG